MKNKYKTEEKKNPKLVGLIIAVHLKERVKVPELEKAAAAPSSSEGDKTEKAAPAVEKEDGKKQKVEDEKDGEAKEDEESEIEGALSESSEESDSDGVSDDDMRVRDLL